MGCSVALMLVSINNPHHLMRSLVPDQLYLVGLKTDEVAILCVWWLVDIQRMYKVHTYDKFRLSNYL